MSPVAKIVVAIIGILVVLVGIGWLGFQIHLSQYIRQCGLGEIHCPTQCDHLPDDLYHLRAGEIGRTAGQGTGTQFDDNRLLIVIDTLQCFLYLSQSSRV